MSTAQREHMLGDLVAPDIADLLEHKQTAEARAALLELNPVEIAEVIPELAPAQQALAFRMLPKETAAQVISYLPEEEQEALVSGLSSEQLAQIFNEMAPDDRAMLFEEMPGQVASKVLALLRPEERRQTQVILGYPPESVGRLMTPDYVAIRPAWTAQQVLDHLRKVGKDAEVIHYLYIIDEQGKLLDDIRLRQVLLADPAATVESLMNRQFVFLRATDDREEAVRMMEKYDRGALPVVDRDDILVGIVTFDDVADVAQEETTEDIQKMGGVDALDEPYITVSLWELVRKRGGWLSALFLGEMLTASAMAHFEGEIQRAVVLSLFIPLIISSGGNSGSQASTLIIRALALREVTLRDWFRVFRRELACGLALGVLLGALGFVRVLTWQRLGWVNYGEHYLLIAGTVSASLIGVVIWGTLIGSMLPFALRALKLDPATISAPFVATLVDVTGLIIYFTTALVILRGALL